MDQPGVRSDGAPDLLRIAGVDVGELDAVVGNDLVEEPRRAAIHIRSADDVIAGLQHGDQRRNGRHAAGKHMRGAAAFERRQVLFERLARGIRDAGVFVSLVLTDLFLRVGGSEIDGHIDCAGGGSGA